MAGAPQRRAHAATRRRALGLAPRTRQLLERLRRADQAEGPVAAAADDDRDDVRRRRPLAAAGRADLPRRLPLGRRRRRGQPLVRPRHRRADGAHRRRGRSPPGASRPRAALPFGCALARALAARALADRQPARRGAVVRGLPRLRVRLHGLAEAPHAAEHRDRRRRRRGAAARRLGGGDGLGQRHGGDPVLHRLLLDAAALLGAVAADEGRVRARSACRCCRSCAARPRRAGRSCSTRCCSTRSPSCRSARAASARSTSSPRSCSGSASSPARCGCTAAPTAASALRLYLFSLAYLALLFCAMVADAHL